MTSHEEFKEKCLKNPEVKKEYDALKPEFDEISKKERLMAEGYKAMAKENIQLAEQFFEMIFQITIKLPKLTDEQIKVAFGIDPEEYKGPLSEYRTLYYTIAQAQIDLIKEANKNIVWED